jgi:hypothetical protein
MDLSKLNTGEKIAGASAVLLFIVMFFDWFGLEIAGATAPDANGSAWNVLDFIPIVLVVTILVALINVFLKLSDSKYEPPVSINVAVTVLGGISTLLVLFRIADPPSYGSVGGIPVDVSVAFGIVLGLMTAAGIAFGGYRAMKEEGTTFASAADKLAGGDPRKS